MKCVRFEVTNSVATVHLDISGHHDVMRGGDLWWMRLYRGRDSAFIAKDTQSVGCFTHTVDGS